MIDHIARWSIENMGFLRAFMAWWFIGSFAFAFGAGAFIRAGMGKD